MTAPRSLPDAVAGRDGRPLAGEPGQVAGVAAMGAGMDTLTAEQVTYLASWDAGT